jgi:diketogulonate reductase-like aldo/keto reductase
MNTNTTLTRRQFLAVTAALLNGLYFSRPLLASPRIVKPIPKSGEKIPVIGMGTSRTFESLDDPALIGQLQSVLQTFFDLGGGLIDSSPMYGSAETVLGQLLPLLEGKKSLFAATKVWTQGRQQGINQMQRSRQLWGIPRFDLMQIHNLVDWETHLQTLLEMKAEGKVRYIGITTSHGRFHNQLESILQNHDFDFVQLSYNIADRDVESRLLPIALENNVAVIINRPYARGSLFRQVKGKTLPGWVEEFDCNSWGQYFLKYAVSHPAVTCAIPATTKVKHLKDNMQAGLGRLPDAQMRIKMASHFNSL